MISPLTIVCVTVVSRISCGVSACRFRDSTITMTMASTTLAVPEAAQATSAPVGVSLSHLRWWMTWATPDTAVRNPALFYMLAMSFSTRSSTERNGSLHSTVR